MPLTAQVTLSIVAHESSAGDLSSTLRATPAAYAETLTDGVGAGKSQVAWSSVRTMAATTETVTPAALADTRSGAAATVSLTAIKAVYAKNTGSGSLSFAGGPFPAGGQTVASGAVVAHIDASASGLAATGITVTGASGRSYELLLIGEGTVS